MSITADIIKLRFNVQPEYDQQQMNELKKDLKDSEQILKWTYKDIEKNTTSYKKLNQELRNLKANRDRLNAIKSRTKEEDEQLKRINKRIAECSQKIEENKERGKELSQSYREQTTVVQQANKKLEDFFGKMDLGAMSLSDLTARQKDLNLLVRELKPGTADFERYTKALHDTNVQIEKTKTEIYGTKNALENSESAWQKFSKWIVAINAALAVKDRIVAWADQYVQSFAKMDEAMTDVMKYTGQTKAEVEDMNEAFKQMTTRTAREELNALAGAAGRLGIQGKENIIGFVDAADKINVALGDDLGEGAIDQIGKLTMVFGEDKTKGLNGAMLATGSAINVLGANSSANTGFITEFTSDMAGMAVNAKIAQTDIMGYASALSQAGVEGKTASGVFAQLITKMFTDPAKFAKAAKLDVKAFTDLLKTDANAAILQFLEGLKQNGGFDALAPALKSLKMQGTQAVPVISSLINKMDELKKAQNDARKAYDEGTSIIDEFNNANSSAAAKLEMAQKALNDEAVTLGQKLMPIVESSLVTGKMVLQVISSLITFTISHRKTIITLGTAIGAYSAALAVAWAWEKRIAVEKAINLAMDKAITLATKAKTIVVAAYSLLVNRLQGHTIAAARAQITLNAAMNANVFAAVAATIAAVVAVGVQLYNRLTDIGEAQRTLNDASKEARTRMIDEQTEMEQLINTVKSANSSEEDRKKALEEINGRLMEKHLGNLTEEQIRTGQAKAVLDLYNQSLMDQIENEVLLGKLKEARTKQMNAENGEFDTSFVDDAQAVMKAIGGYWKGMLVPGKHALTEMKNSWNGAMEETRQKVLVNTQKTIDAVQDKIKENREKLSFNQEMAKTLSDARIKLENDGSGNTSVNNDGSGGSGGSGGKTDKEKAERDKKRKELEAQEKAAYERELLLLRQQYQGRKGMQDEWHQKELIAEQRYLGKISQLRDEYNADESEKMEILNKKLDSDIKEANLREEQRKRNLQEALHKIDIEQSEKEMELLRQQLDGEIKTQEEFNQKKLQVEIDYQKKRINKLQQGSAEYLASQNQLLSLELQQKQQAEKEKEDFMNSYHNTGNSILQDRFSQAESFKEMLRLNDEYRKTDQISEQQYQQNLTAITQEQNEARRQIEQATIDTINQAMQATSQLFQLMQQRETAAVDAKYKKLIAAAKKQGKDTTKLEEQQEAEKQAIKKKYADKQFQLQVLQIIAATAMAIANVWREWAWMPAVAAALTAAAAAQGAIQLATAKMAAEQASGLYEGGYSDEYQEGYTAKGNPREQAGVIPVHKNEFVANHQAVANPQVRPLLDVIDHHQKIGDIRMLDATRMLEEAYGRGRYRGGYTADVTDQPEDGSRETLRQTDPEVKELLRDIRANTAEGLTVKELRREIRHQERLESNASR